MPFDLRIDSVTFSDGTTVPIPAHGVVALVGPNNAGKSAALREVLSHIMDVTPGTVIKRVAFSVSGTADDALRWLETNCYKSLRRDGGPPTTYLRGKRKLYADYIDQGRFSPDASQGLGNVAQLTCVLLTAEERLEAASSVAAHDPGEEPPTSPIQELIGRDDLEQQLRAEASQAFGAEFIIRRAPDKRIYPNVA